MAGEMEYLYMMFGLGLCVPVFCWLLVRWLSVNFSHMRQLWNDWCARAAKNFEEDSARTREILRRKNRGR